MSRIMGITNAHICTAAGVEYQNGSVFWDENGILQYVGEKDNIFSIEVIDAKGSWVVPGFIDAHTHLGIQESGVGISGDDICETGGNMVTPGMRAIDGIAWEDIAFRDALSGGVTTVMVLPGSDNVISGLGAIIKTIGNSYDQRIVCERAALKGALGEMPKEAGVQRKRMPTSRMGEAWLMRKTFQKGLQYLNEGKKDNWRKKDLDMEAVAMVLEGKIPFRVHAFKSEDIYTAIRIAREFHIRLVIDHGLEAYKVISELKKEHVPVTFGTAFNWKSSCETRETDFLRAKELIKEGVEVSMITDHGCTPIQYLPLCAAMLFAEGITREEALKTITVNPARVLGIDEKVGSIEVGKEADISVFQRDFLGVGAKADMVFIKGRQVR